MEWRDPPGRLNEVRRLTDAMRAEREADLKANGALICMACGFQGNEDAYIGHGAYRWNESTQRFDLPASEGRLVYECPKCHHIDNGLPKEGTGIHHMTGWWPRKGEWYPVTCEDERCHDKGQVYIAMACPGCGTFMFWHHASNHEKGRHAWSIHINEDGTVLTMSPSLFENPPTGCHMFIKGNRVEWCG